MDEGRRSHGFGPGSAAGDEEEVKGWGAVVGGVLGWERQVDEVCIGEDSDAAGAFDDGVHFRVRVCVGDDDVDAASNENVDLRGKARVG